MTITIAYRKLDGEVVTRKVIPLESRVAKLSKYTTNGRPANRRYMLATDVESGKDKSFYYDCMTVVA